MNERLKIAIFNDSFYPMVDGVVNVVTNFATILSRTNDVTVFVPESTDPDYKDNFPFKVVRVKSYPFKFGEYTLAVPGIDLELRKILKNERFDIVHIHTPFSMGEYAVNYCKKNHIPVVAHLHTQFHRDFKLQTKSEILTKLMTWTISEVFNECNELWTMNPRLGELAWSYGYEGPVFILPNGCDMKKENLQPEHVAECRARYLKPEEKMLLFVGRLNKNKNLDFSIDVCKKLKEKGFPFKFVIVGEGQHEHYFKKRVHAEEMEDKIIFTERITDRTELQYFYAAGDLLLFPSSYDADSIVKNEASAFATPTLFLKGSITASSVTNNVNGYLEVEDDEKFAKRIIGIFSDEELHRQVGENAQRDLYRTWDDVVETALKNYRRVIREFEKTDKPLLPEKERKPKKTEQKEISEYEKKTYQIREKRKNGLEKKHRTEKYVLEKKQKKEKVRKSEEKPEHGAKGFIVREKRKCEFIKGE